MWTGLIGFFILVVAVGLCTAQTAEKYVPVYQLQDGRVVSIDVESILPGKDKEKDFVVFKARVAVDRSNYITDTILTNCKEMRYAFMIHDKVENDVPSTEVPDDLVKVQAKKGTVIYTLITDICEATKLVRIDLQAPPML